MKVMNAVATLLLVVGGLNWGLVGICGCNFVELFLDSSIAVRTVYYLVGLAALYHGASLTLAAVRKAEIQN